MSDYKEAEDTLLQYTVEANAKINSVIVKSSIEISERLCNFMSRSLQRTQRLYRTMCRIEPFFDLCASQIELLRADEERRSKSSFESLTLLSPPSSASSTSIPSKQGYLMRKRKSKGWAIRWVVVQNGIMQCFRKWKVISPSNLYFSLQ